MSYVSLDFSYICMYLKISMTLYDKDMEAFTLLFIRVFLFYIFDSPSSKFCFSNLRKHEVKSEITDTRGGKKIEWKLKRYQIVKKVKKCICIFICKLSINITHRHYAKLYVFRRMQIVQTDCCIYLQVEFQTTNNKKMSQQNLK